MKSTSRRILATAAAIAALASTASLNAVVIDFSGGPVLLATGVGLNFGPVSGVTVTATAWSNSSTSGGTFNAARLGQYGEGLGVTNGTGDSDHEVDNIGTFDFVLLSFNQVVDVQSIRLEFVGADSDLEVWYGNSSTLSTLYAGPSVINSGGNDDRTADISAGNAIGQYILIGAQASTSDDDDTFKIRKITFDTTTTNTPGVPDGGSAVLLLGAALAGLGLAARRNKLV